MLFRFMQKCGLSSSRAYRIFVKSTNRNVQNVLLLESWTQGAPLWVMIEIILYLFLKTYLNPLIIDYFFSRSSVNILNCSESLYYHSTWRFTKYRWSLTSENAGAKRRRRRKKGEKKGLNWTSTGCRLMCSISRLFSGDFRTFFADLSRNENENTREI